MSSSAQPATLSPKTEKLRVGILGAGLIAGKKHIPAYRKHSDKVTLAAICDLNRSAAEKAAAAYGIPASYGDVAEMFSKERLDLVDICTPPQTHARLAVEAMKQGSHVLIEKPMALSVADCDAIVNAGRELGRKVCVAHSDLFYPPFVRARKMVADGEIGELRGMRIFLSTPTDYMTLRPDHWAHKLPGGVIGETGPHVVYLSLAFVNPIRDVKVQGTKLLDYPWSRFEDYRIDLIGDRAVSSIALSYGTNQWLARVEIIGSQALLTLDLEAMVLVKHELRELKPLRVGLSVLSETSQTVRGLLANWVRYATGRLGSTHETIVGEFARSIQNGTEPPVTGEDGRETVRVLNMIVEKLDGKREAVQVGKATP